MKEDRDFPATPPRPRCCPCDGGGLSRRRFFEAAGAGALLGLSYSLVKAAEAEAAAGAPAPPRLPLVVKPVSEGSTLGITIVRKARDLQKGLDAAFAYGPAALIEEYIDGREFTVGILSDKALPVVEIIPQGGFYDFAAKYTPGASVYKAPAPLPSRTAKLLQALALQAPRRLGCRGATRVDFRLDRKGRPFVLELNTVPGMTETSLLPMAAKAARLSYEDMVEAILESALAREAEWAPQRHRG